jgi:signal transduction histidine kinase
VQDNGQGFNLWEVSREANHSRSGLGLISMRERVDSIGGQLTIESSKGQGTRVFAMLPVRIAGTNGDKS